MSAIYALLLTCDVRRLVEIAAGLGLGLALSAIYFVPLLFERDYVRISRLLSLDYAQCFLFEHLRPAFKTKLFTPDLSSYAYSDLLKSDNYLYLLKTEPVALGALALFLAVTGHRASF